MPSIYHPCLYAYVHLCVYMYRFKHVIPSFWSIKKGNQKGEAPYDHYHDHCHHQHNKIHQVISWLIYLLRDIYSVPFRPPVQRPYNPDPDKLANRHPSLTRPTLTCSKTEWMDVPVPSLHTWHSLISRSGTQFANGRPIKSVTFCSNPSGK